MVQIIENSRNIIVCPRCSSTLSYAKKDKKVDSKMAYYINCPNCDMKVSLEEDVHENINTVKFPEHFNHFESCYTSDAIKSTMEDLYNFLLVNPSQEAATTTNEFGATVIALRENNKIRFMVVEEGYQTVIGVE